MSRSWLLYLDDLIASAERIGRLTTGRRIERLVALATQHLQGVSKESGAAQWNTRPSMR